MKAGRVRNFWIFVGGVLLAAACAPSPRPGADVWDSYDIRHPLPAGSEVPDSYARQYDGVIDNDAYYSAPTCSIIDSPACGE